jgi:hypothetical protein
MTTLTPELRQAIEQAGDVPARVVDPETNTTYVLLRAEVYEQYKALFESEDEDLDPSEMYPLIDEVFGREGWDDPKMDAYDDYEAHRP